MGSPWDGLAKDMVFPGNWQISPRSNYCPSPGAILFSFLITNLVVTSVGFFLALLPHNPQAHLRPLRQARQNAVRCNGNCLLSMQILANVVYGAIIWSTEG